MYFVCDLLIAEAKLRNTEQPEVGDHNLPVLQEDVLRLQILVDDTSRVQVTHSLEVKKIVTERLTVIECLKTFSPSIVIPILLVSAIKRK